MRPSKRAPDMLRTVSLEPGVAKHAEGSCLVKFGDTHVLVTASLEEKPPPFLKGSGKGWVTAEYGMLPRSTHERMRREAAQGKQSGRTLEIQRLIGRSLRAVVDLAALGERQIVLDCDVIQADGGTRTASITGGFVALHQCIGFMKKTGMITKPAIKDQVAAISCGIWQGDARARSRLRRRFDRRDRREFRAHRLGRPCGNSGHGGRRAVQRRTICGASETRAQRHRRIDRIAEEGSADEAGARQRRLSSPATITGKVREIANAGAVCA